MIHNGQSDEYIGVIENYTLLPLEEILYTWQTLKELLDGGEFEDFPEVESVGPVKKNCGGTRVGFRLPRMGEEMIFV